MKWHHLINLLNRNWTEMESKYEKIIEIKNKEIKALKVEHK